MRAVLLISRSAWYGARLDTALRGRVVTVGGSLLDSGSTVGLESLEAARLDAAFVGPLLPSERAAQAIALLHERFPSLPIVLVHENARAGADWARKRGADAVISPAADDATIAALVEHLNARDTLVAEAEPWSGHWGYEHLEMDAAGQLADEGGAASDPDFPDASAEQESFGDGGDDDVAPELDTHRPAEQPGAAAHEHPDEDLLAHESPAGGASSDDDEAPADGGRALVGQTGEDDPHGEDDASLEQRDDVGKHVETGPPGTVEAWQSPAAPATTEEGLPAWLGGDAWPDPALLPGEPAVARPAVPSEPQAELQVAERDSSQIIAVVSPKGGLGKTTIATNLAVGLARIFPDSVVLVDGDLQFGDVASALDITPTHTLPDMVSGLATRDSIVLKTLLAPHSTGLFVVCGSNSPEGGEGVTAEQFGRLLEQLSGIFRYVIVDTSPGLGEHALTALDQATDAVIVSGLTVPALRAVRTEISVLEGIGAMPARRHVVLNMVNQRWGLRRQDAENIVGAPMDTLVPRSDAVPFSINRGIPLLQEGSKDPAALALVDLMARVFKAGDRRLLRRDRKKKVAA